MRPARQKAGAEAKERQRAAEGAWIEGRASRVLLATGTSAIAAKPCLARALTPDTQAGVAPTAIVLPPVLGVPFAAASGASGYRHTMVGGLHYSPAAVTDIASLSPQPLPYRTPELTTESIGPFPRPPGIGELP